MLTKRQQELFDYLKQHHRETGIMPSTREIQKHFDFASQTAAVSHLKALEKKGVIQRLPGKARALIFTEEYGTIPDFPAFAPDVMEIPIMGRIAAGMATDVGESREGTLTLDPRAIGLTPSTKAFALKVRGESMIDAHIVDGDMVILEFKDPRNHDIVAALIDGETTLKRFVIEKGRTYLKAENPHYPELVPAHELIVQGVMVGLLRIGSY